MKFKDKDGKVFEDVGELVVTMCRQQGGCSSGKDNICPILYKTQHSRMSCYDWSVANPAEAARLMGYEVVEEETCDMCVYNPPSSGSGKPCSMCDTSSPMLNCYQKKEEPDETCASCINEYPPIECVNCGSKHWNYKAKDSEGKEVSCETCKYNDMPIDEVDNPCWTCKGIYLSEYYEPKTKETNMDKQNKTPPCKWCQDEICVNADSPMRADYCPVPNVPGMCKYEEREKPMLKNITKIYLAGKITDDPDYKSKFERAEQDYISKGKIVLNPAKLPKGMGNADYMRICFAMLESADAAFFLPGWEQSAGAQLEYRWCLYTGKTIMYSTKKGEDK